MRIITSDPKKSKQNAPRLISLAHKLQSYIEMRGLDQQYSCQRKLLIIADCQTLFYQLPSSRWQATSEINSTYTARQHLKNFDDLWEKAQSNIELRSFVL